MTNLKFPGILRDKSETPYVVSYFFNRLLWSSALICFRSAGLRPAAAWIAWGGAAAHRAALLSLGHCQTISANWIVKGSKPKETENGLHNCREAFSIQTVWALLIDVGRF